MKKHSSSKNAGIALPSTRSYNKYERDRNLARKLRIIIIGFFMILLGLMLGLSMMQIVFLT